MPRRIRINVLGGNRTMTQNSFLPPPRRADRRWRRRAGDGATFKPTKPIEIVVHTVPGSGPRHLRPHGHRRPSSRRSSRRCASRSSNKVGGGGITAANYMVEGKGDAHMLARVHQRLDDQSAGAEGGRRTKVVDMTPISRLVVEPGGDRGARGLAVQDAARRHRGCAQGSGRRSSRPAARRWRATPWCASS